MMYLLYARSGKEFEVAQALRKLSDLVICEPRITFVRKGKDRRPTPQEEPYLPNYIFADLSDTDFHAALKIKHIASRAIEVGTSSAKAIGRYQKQAQTEYKEAQRIAHNQEAKPIYKPGQALRILNSAMGETLATFSHMVDRQTDPFPRVVAEIEIFGRPTKIELDPLDVRPE